MARTYWIDRALGNRVPDALAAAGVAIRRYSDTYPTQNDVEDARWIPDIARRGWVIVTKDQNMRRRPDEIEALLTSEAIYVCLAAGNLKGEQQAQLLLEHWRTLDGFIEQRGRGPLIVNVTREGVRWLDDDHWRPVKRKR